MAAHLNSVTLDLSRPTLFLTIALISASVYTWCTVWERNSLRSARAWFFVRRVSNVLFSCRAFSVAWHSSAYEEIGYKRTRTIEQQTLQ
jgi:hypothetical protein